MLKQFEIWISALLVLLTLIIYILYALISDPSGGHPFGHLMGVVGLILMLITETLYSLRKRVRWFQFGQLRYWLSFHIITGIIGPWLALLHTAFEFRGLAGVAMLLTTLVVLSGFIGRYIYTAVPRTMSGAVVTKKALEAQVLNLQADLERWAGSQSESVQTVISRFLSSSIRREASSVNVLLRFIHKWRDKRDMRQLLNSLSQVDRNRLLNFEFKLHHHRELDRQIASLKTTQRLLRYWHRIHVPLGLTLFASIAIHIGATLYFGAFAP